jgi:hypothetical protein
VTAEEIEALKTVRTGSKWRHDVVPPGKRPPARCAGRSRSASPRCSSPGLRSVTTEEIEALIPTGTRVAVTHRHLPLCLPLRTEISPLAAARREGIDAGDRLCRRTYFSVFFQKRKTPLPAARRRAASWRAHLRRAFLDCCITKAGRRRCSQTYDPHGQSCAGHHTHTCCP